MQTTLAWKDSDFGFLGITAYSIMQQRGRSIEIEMSGKEWTRPTYICMQQIDQRTANTYCTYLDTKLMTLLADSLGKMTRGSALAQLSNVKT